MLIGAHMSTAGGLHTAFERGDALACTAIQIFTSSPRQWRPRNLSGADVVAFREAWSASSCEICVAHDIYLTRLGTRDPQILARSRDAFRDQLTTCQTLGVSGLVMHPVGDSDVDENAVLDRVAASLDAIFEAVPDEGTRVCLETTAGQGANVGYSFEQLARIIAGVDQRDRLAVCLDTCHVFAAGYDISTRAGYEATWSEFDTHLGFGRLDVLHCNDSQKPCGSRVDRHAHLGHGEIGEQAFEWIVRDDRFTHVPRILETPRDEGGVEADLELLRSACEEEP